MTKDFGLKSQSRLVLILYSISSILLPWEEDRYLTCLNFSFLVFEKFENNNHVVVKKLIFDALTHDHILTM